MKTPRDRHRAAVEALAAAFLNLEREWDETTHDDTVIVDAYPFPVSLDEMRAEVFAYADSLAEVDHRTDAAMGRRLRNLHARWTADDEVEGECANSGSGADVAEAVFGILTDHGFPIT
jgi:hypothetical protein